VCFQRMSGHPKNYVVVARRPAAAPAV